MSEPRRTGRWRSGIRSRQRILDAARRRFARDGYAGTAVRAIARDAEVDVAMVYYFFESKDGLFTESMALDRHPLHHLSALLDDGPEDIGHRVVRRFLELWDVADEDFEPMHALWASAVGHQRARQILEETLRGPLIQRLSDEFGIEAASLRVGLMTAHLMGITMARYRICIEPFHSTDRETLVAWVGPVIQHYLTGPAPAASSNG